MLFANAVFLFGSAIAGRATSMTMLIVGRGVAGMGAGGLMAMMFIILSDMLDMRERGKYVINSPVDFQQPLSRNSRLLTIAL